MDIHPSSASDIPIPTRGCVERRKGLRRATAKNWYNTAGLMTSSILNCTVWTWTQKNTAKIVGVYTFWENFPIYAWNKQYLKLILYDN